MLPKKSGTSFHNTIQLDVFAQADLNNRALSMEDKVLDFFRTQPSIKFTPFRVHELMQLTCPITSTRRAITNLTTSGKLTKSKETVLGNYNVPNFQWYYDPILNASK